MTTAALAWLARRHPGAVEPRDDLVRALAFLEVDVAAETLVRAGSVAALSLFALALAVLAAVTPAAVALPGAAAVGAGTLLASRRLPVIAADLRRTRALGAASAVLGRAALRMRIEASPERAASFAARTGDGPLSRSLAGHVRRARGTPTSGLGDFAAEWSDWFPALERASAQVEVAAAAEGDDRARALDRALEAVRDETRDRLASFASSIRGPVTGLYAFGVLLPLALLGVLPAARVAGLDVGVAHLVVLYDVLLPFGLVAGGVDLLTRRPVAFPPPRIARSHPDVPDARWPAVGVAVAVGVTSWLSAAALVGDWAGPLAGAGGGLGALLVTLFRPFTSVRDDVRAVEAGLDDAVAFVGRRVTDGVAVETAIGEAGETLPGRTGEVFTEATGVKRRLQIGVREAFLGDHGALTTVPSPRARGAAGLLALAATEGRPAGAALLATADHLAALRRVERDGRRQLSSVTDTLSNTAALFGPLVAGATVALVARMRSGGGGTLESGLAPSEVGVAIGWYTLLLAVLLTGLATALEHGLDRALVGYRVGLAMLSATVTFLTAVVAAGLLV